MVARMVARMVAWLILEAIRAAWRYLRLDTFSAAAARPFPCPVPLCVELEVDG